ncbi:Guanine nucleotide-binding protein alpha-4 subunit [Psilocybe cubensis]|uniref:Guanine nucleotide-binding protein alpha-4 subunit n=2 Tax=Psilocybe cubensis TaxID=181762 RepID=A0ACB8HBY3_PSICU|nr:Guanine nucleotide-binding protein alpha-4 subunit [Psilocybe cubensis]KAH9485207.1 Guanine nucleotide-binding protein alpha-4 subunit [Psilocybe cubensis]
MPNETDNFDPLSLAIAPPPDETPEERIVRELAEREAVLRSREIDAELKAAKVAMKRYKNAIKILVLGQSLSGKSTTIKNFQRKYAQKAWADERATWKAIILFNLVRSVNIMIDALNRAPVYDPQKQAASPIIALGGALLAERHQSIILRLAPLREVEKDLKLFLGAGATEVEAQTYTTPNEQNQVMFEFKKSNTQEFCVRSSSGWRGVIDRIKTSQNGKESQVHRVVSQVVDSCKADILWLWKDPVTQSILHSQRLRLEDSPGFFIDDIDRIVATDYEPSDHDIMRARLRTTGVQEHHFMLDRTNGTKLDWIMYDVAGIRTSRAAWVPYFKEVTGLLFLAPISAFNERLEEDTSIFRLEDTFMLWKTLCGNKLLSRVQLILFLNKTDLLRKKLEQGILVKKYMPEFDKENTYENVATWFRKIFKKYFIQHSEPGRSFISHFTSVIDTEATSVTLIAVQSAILQHDMAEVGLL